MPKHQLDTFGGSHAAAIYSGGTTPVITSAPNAVAVGSDVMLHSGAGRLAGISMHPRSVSADTVAINFYDAVAPVSGGPIAASGHVFLASVPANIGQVASGITTFPNVFIPIGMPFRQGLCVNSRSGQPGFTATFSPDK